MMLNGKRTRLSAFIVALLLLLASCGSANSGNHATEERVASAQEIAARTFAEQNTQLLQLTQELGSTEVLDGETGGITNLSEVVTGDRAVVIWYWTPH